MKWQRPWSFVVAISTFLLLVKFTFFFGHFSSESKLKISPAPSRSQIGSQGAVLSTVASPPPTSVPSLHPVAQLENVSLSDFECLISSQSKTLTEAVREYKRRYGIHPPPLYDKWYSFAKKRNLQLVDEFDVVHDSLTPFWALKPSSIRARVREALGYEPNGLITLQIRNGKVVRLDGGPDWQMTVMNDMMKDFVHLLPDMDLAFNLHDEPRIVVPHDELSEMVRIAKRKAMPAAVSTQKPKKSFSTRPKDVDDGRRRLKIPPSSRFNEYQHQAVWVPSRMSCHPQSPARDFHDRVEDETGGFAMSNLGFVFNQTAFSDICSMPSLRNAYGFFQRPNAFKVSHELIPIFSQSKLSSFQDILYPSPWYHYGKTVTDKGPETHKIQYNKSLDDEWSNKRNTLWWRGSTTGGFSREGGWRRQHRQIVVSNINAAHNSAARIFTNRGTIDNPKWRTQEVERGNFSHLIDVHFSGVGQCDPGDCDAQREYFDIAQPVDNQEAWKYKFVLDMDGNAFSGRFYSFLRSKSLPFKLSIFREWHQDWLLPWTHYVPLSLRGTEHLETVRYFAEEEEGMKSAANMAARGKDWAERVLRNEDLEIWLFRLLLEYARVIDDNRETIGFDL